MFSALLKVYTLIYLNLLKVAASVQCYTPTLSAYNHITERSYISTWLNLPQRTTQLFPIAPEPKRHWTLLRTVWLSFLPAFSISKQLLILSSSSLCHIASPSTIIYSVFFMRNKNYFSHFFQLHSVNLRKT